MAKAPTAEQKRRWDKIAAMGCIICSSPACIHHAMTGGGGRKNHDLVLPLCHHHHQGAQGIHTLGRKAWARIYKSEEEYLRILDNMLASSE